MSANFKPGDVAMAMRHDGSECRAILRADYTWRLAEACDNNPPTREFRPLVVIDPESPDDLDGLCKALVEAMYTTGHPASAANGVHPATAQAALRKLASPAPDEPQGLGAVVEDAGGRRWSRVADMAGNPYWMRLEMDGDHVTTVWTGWSGVNAVRVLDPEGVTP